MAINPVLQTGLLNQSSAQGIDGALRFDGSKSNRLVKTFGSSSNRTTWTWSGWIKKDAINRTIDQCLFGAYGANNDTDWFEFGFGGSSDHSPVDKFYWTTNSTTSGTTERFRDNSAWYHCLVTYNGIEITVYINNKLLLTSSKTGNLAINGNFHHSIGMGPKLSNSPRPFFGSMSQVYLIDGLQIGPGYFGFTDPLTGTWRPKKFRAEGTTVNDGTVWSNSTNSGLTHADGVTGMFDGSLSTRGGHPSGSNLNSYVTIIDGASITARTGIRIYWNGVGAGQRFIRINESTELDDGSAQLTPGWSSISSFSGTINKLEVKTAGTGSWSFSAIEIDGVILRDGVTQNLQYGTNGFYLPFDGNSPVGQDKSGKGNDFTPVNFGGSTDIAKATGGLPILNTVSGGNVAIPGTRTDEYASNIVMAIPFLGNVNDISADIRGSGSNLSVTTSGSPAADSDPTQWYGSSFNVSTGNYIDTIGTTSTFAFLHQPEAAGTVEGWINTNAINNQGPWFQTSNGTNETGVMFRQNSSTNLAVQINRGVSGQAIVIDSSITVAHGIWYHWAFVKSANGYAQFFLNGVPTGDKVPISTAAGASNAASTSSTSSYAGRIARNHGEDRGVGANICDYRAYTIQKYAFDTPFIPASINPDILPDTPSGVSGSSKLNKVIGGSAGGFETTSDYLSLPASSDFNFTGDHTIEFFVYHNTLANDSVPYSTGASGTPDQIYISSAGGMNYAYGQTGALSAPAGTIAIKRWHHIAVSKSGTNLRMFVDGKIVASSSNHSSTIGSSSNGPRIGARRDGYHPTQGFISNLRVVKGSAVYTSEFTPPTAPLTNVTNTKLLCCQSNTQAGSAAVSPNLAAAINDGTVWSDFLSTAGGFGGTHVRVRAFDGDTNTMAGTASNTGYSVTGNDTNALEFIPPSPIAYSSSIKVRGRNTGQTTMGVKIDTGSGYGSEIALSGDGLQTVISGSGNLVKIKVYTKTYSGENELGGIQIDDVYLTDPITVYGDSTRGTTFNPFNTDINTVRGQESGYATWNSLKMGTSDVSMSEGNLFWRTTSNGPDKCTYSTIGMDSGKWYWENEVVEATATAIGIANVHANPDAGPANAHNWMYYSATGQVYLDGSASSYGAAYNTNGTIIGVAFDRDNLTLEFYKNGISQGKLTSISGLTDSETYFAMCGDSGGASQSQVRANFGQKPFKFPPPEGFQPLNAVNVRPETVIARPDKFFNITEWSGNNADPRQIDLGMAPDLIWVKTRNQTNWHWLSDSLRGTADKRYKWYANSDSAQDTAPIYGQADSFNDFGFVAGGGTDGSNPLSDSNQTGTNYVCWSWKAGGSKGTFNKDDVGYASAAAAGLSGQSSNITIDSCSIGTKQGFSMVKVTPSDNSAFIVPHGLSQQPDFLIIKNLGATQNNDVFFRGVTGSTQVMEINSNLAVTTTGVTVWSAVDSTKVHARGASFATNNNPRIVYFWHSVPGFSKFGTYTGRGSTYPVIELGFRPAMIWIKDTTTGGTHYDWQIFDSKRNPSNLGNDNTDSKNVLFTNTNDQENKGSNPWAQIDFLSNGFRMNDASVTLNSSDGHNYIYCAWAEAPVSNLYGGSANAF